MQHHSAPLGDNVHKLPLDQGARAEKTARISKAMRALLEKTVAEKESEAYARGFVDGGGPKFLTLVVGLCCGGVMGFVVGLLVQFTAHAAK